MMLTIRNKQNDKLMVTNDVPFASIKESINREYNLGFSVLYDHEKTQHIKPLNVAEISDDLFDIVYLKESHNDDGSKTINVDCEHVSYRLNDEQYDLEYFTSHGTAHHIMSEILQGTPFSVGVVDVDGTHTISIQEEMSRRAMLIMFAEQLEAELVFHRFTVSLVKKRGKDEGQQFRIGKNAKGIAREIDAREKVDGQPKTAYEINVVELGYFHGYGDLENIELGDTWKVIDEELELVTTQRVVSYEYDPIRKISSRVEIANFIEDLSDELFRIQKETVHKDTVYNGIRIGPVNGFEAIRSDNMARTVMNATEGIKIQKGDGSGGNWHDVIFLDTEGDARFTGRIEASEIYGSLIEGSTFKTKSSGAVYETETVISGGLIQQISEQDYGVGFIRIGAGGIMLEQLGHNAEIHVEPSGASFIGGRGIAFLNPTNYDTEMEVNHYGINGIKFEVNGTDLIVYKNGSYVGHVELTQGWG